MPELECSPAQPHELNHVAAMLRRGVVEEFGVPDSAELAWRCLDQARGWMGSDWARVLVLREDGSPIGMVAVVPYRDVASGCLEAQAVSGYILRGSRGLRALNALVGGAVDFARNIGAASISCSSSLSEGFWRRIGGRAVRTVWEMEV